MVGDQLIGPRVFQSPHTSTTYWDFLEHHPPGLLDVIPVPQLAEIIYQHDRASAHSSNAGWNFPSFPDFRDGLVVRGQFLGYLDRQI